MRRLGMMGFGKLRRLPVGAPHAVFGGDERRDQKALMVIGVRFALLRPMAFDTADPLRRVAADFPIVDAADCHVLGHVAVDAFLVLSRNKWTETAAPALFDLHVANTCQCKEKDETQPADHIAGEVL